MCIMQKSPGEREQINRAQREKRERVAQQKEEWDAMPDEHKIHHYKKRTKMLMQNNPYGMMQGTDYKGKGGRGNLQIAGTSPWQLWEYGIIDDEGNPTGKDPSIAFNAGTMQHAEELNRMGHNRRATRASDRSYRGHAWRKKEFNAENRAAYRRMYGEQLHARQSYGASTQPTDYHSPYD